MLLLFLQIFRSRADLCKWIIKVERRNGFVIVTKKLDSCASSKKPRITLAYEMNKQHRESKKDMNQEKKHVVSGSKKCRCPFELKGKKLSTDDDWILLVVCGVHNHSTAVHLKDIHMLEDCRKKRRHYWLTCPRVGKTKGYFGYTETKRPLKCYHNEDNIQCTTET